SYDEGVGALRIVPQDISRVFINVLENASYATQQRMRRGVAGYSPKVWVTSARKGSTVEVTIRDNGDGIAPEPHDKIFNPFFTTKPPGDGTGLGLSISYDIVVRKHGGEIRVDSQPGEYTALTIALPASGE